MKLEDARLTVPDGFVGVPPLQVTSWYQDEGRAGDTPSVVGVLEGKELEKVGASG